MTEPPPCDPHIDLETMLRKIENHVARSEFAFRGQIVIESDGLLHFIALVREAARCPSST